jgi:mRNA (2'-O-methyladenosine-N6-)-methyltransferase
MIDIKKRKRNEFFNAPAGLNMNIPPLTQKELKGLVVNIFLKELIRTPLDSISLLKYIKKSFRNVDYSSYVISKLKINEIIRELIENKIITAEEMFVNMRRCYYIKNVDYEKLKNFSQNLTDCEIGTDFDKYVEKAKIIMQEYLRETKIEYDNDDMIVNAMYHDGDHHNHKYVNKNKKLRIDDYKIDISTINTQLQIEKENSEDYNSNLDNDNHDGNHDDQNFINSMLYAPTAKVMMNSSQFSDLINSGSASYISVLEKMKSKYGSSLRPFCTHGTLRECEKKTKGVCKNVHFRPMIEPHTDVSLGDCSYLDTCRHMEICKFVHYKIEDEEEIPSNRKELVLSGDGEVLDAQWANCDIRYFDFNILGKFDVIMADPPWDIHMDLPYGTLSDEEMKSLKVKDLQDDGVIFLWVTGRATELARECLEIWGYERKEELVWIKTNQLQRLIRTGRTGHWLNHSKEHCLIGYKGNPKLNRNIDCDVLVSEVRETSRKPDEIYELIERLKPGGRKLELFARPHNRRKGWISLGNQLPGVYFVENEPIERFNETYPDAKLTKEIMEKNKENSIIKKAL